MYEHLMEEVVRDENLARALKAVKRNQGAAGIDHMKTTEAGPLRAGLVGILPTGRSAEANLLAGGLDSTTHPQVFLAEVAQRYGPRACAPTAGGASPPAQNVHTSRGAWGMAAKSIMHTGLGNRALRRYGFLMPSDLAAE